MKRDEVPPLTLSRDSVGDTFRLLPRVDAGISRLRARGGGFAIAPSTPSLPCGAQANPHRKIKPQNAPHPANAADEVRFFCQKVSTEKGVLHGILGKE
jgi:hypothetical protein